MTNNNDEDDDIIINIIFITENTNNDNYNIYTGRRKLQNQFLHANFARVARFTSVAKHQTAVKSRVL